jgi:hypothetical protein
VQHSYILGPVSLSEFEFMKIIKSKTESLEKDKSKETIHHMYNSEKEIKSTTTVDICNNQEDYDPTTQV